MCCPTFCFEEAKVHHLLLRQPNVPVTDIKCDLRPTARRPVKNQIFSVVVSHRHYVFGKKSYLMRDFIPVPVETKKSPGQFTPFPEYSVGKISSDESPKKSLQKTSLRSRRRQRSLDSRKISRTRERKSGMLVSMNHDSYSNDEKSNIKIKFRSKGRQIFFEATRETAFTYKVLGRNFSKRELEEINAISIEDRIPYIQVLDAKIIFSHIENKTFNSNLMLVKSFLAKILGDLILEFFTTGTNDFQELAKKIDDKNPLRLPFNTKNFYTYKLTQFLSCIALGLTSNQTWNGLYKMTKDYTLVGKSNLQQETLISHSPQFDKYLSRATMLETPNDPALQFGKIRKDKNGNFHLKLNLQIRFK